MNIYAQQMSQTMGHEDGAHVDLHHVLKIAVQNANLHEFFQVNLVSKAVHVSPLHTFKTNLAYDHF